jgi:hypothetical protein
VTERTKRSAREQAPRWRIEAEQRVRAAVRRYRQPLLGLAARAAYETETRALVRDFLGEALGFRDEDLDRPPTAAKHADYGLRVGTELVALVEIKRVATRLDAPPRRLLRPTAGTRPWLVLTNAVEWRLYHLDTVAGTPAAGSPIIEVDLLGPTTIAKKAAVLVHLTRESFERRGIDSLLLAQRALSPDSLSAAVTSVGVLRAIQRELRRKTGQPIDTKAIAQAVREIVPPPGQQT